MNDVLGEQKLRLSELLKDIAVQVDDLVLVPANRRVFQDMVRQAVAERDETRKQGKADTWWLLPLISSCCGNDFM